MGKIEKKRVIQKRLSELLVETKNNPYYSQFLENVPEKEILANPKLILKKFPVLDRELLQQNFPDTLVTPSIKDRMQPNSTSGSTGKPVDFAKDKKYEDFKLAQQILFNTYTGWQIGERHIEFWGAHETSIIGKIWYNFLYRKKSYPPYIKDNVELLTVYTDEMQKQPTLITGYSSALYHIAKSLENLELKFSYSPKGVIASAEGILPFQRETIEDVFNSKVFMRYGTREVDNVAMECELQNVYHILESRYIIEIVNDDNEVVEEGEKGKILITDLMNQVSPFIRYDIGDSGILLNEYECECGRSGAVFKEIIGRSTEFIELPDGSEFPILTLNVVFEQLGPYINQFQLEIVDNENWIINIVPTKNYGQEIGDKIIRELKNYTNNTINIEIIEKEVLKRTKAGKLKLIKYQ